MQPLWRIFLWFAVAAVVFSCGPNNADDDDDAADDDAADDADNDANDDLAIGIEASLNPTLLYDDEPVLSNGYWDSPQTALGEFSGYEVMIYYSSLCWSVCDEGNNLLPDGEIYTYVSGGTYIEWNEHYWSDLHDPPAVDLTVVSDCAQPLEVCLLVLFAPENEPGSPGTFCVDLEATDTDGNLSNHLTDLCVTHDPFGEEIGQRRR